MPYIRRTSIYYWKKKILNEDNDNNPETTDTSQSKKYDMPHTSRDDYIVKVKDKKLCIH